jgi:hypothetical protein
VPKDDAILVLQIGIHCFVILYYHDRKMAIVADGGNIYASDQLAQRVIQSEFKGVNIINVPFYGQNRSNRCASAAVGIIIEFQKLHNRNELPCEVRSTKVVFERIKRVMHKVDTPKVTPWEPINVRSFGITCPSCGKHFSKGQKSWNLEHSQMLNPSAELAVISHSDVGEPYQQQSPEKFISRRRNIAQSEKRVGL